MEKLLQGIVRYRSAVRGDMVKEFVRFRDRPDPSALFFTCVDARLLPTVFTQTRVGDMFIGARSDYFLTTQPMLLALI